MNIFIPREALDEAFSTFRQDNAQKFWSIFGAGGTGKTVLLERFYARCQQEGIPTIFIDFSEPFKEYTAFPGLAIILDARTHHTSHLDHAKAELTASYETWLRKISAHMQTMFSQEDGTDAQSQIPWEPFLEEMKSQLLFGGGQRQNISPQGAESPEKLLWDAFVQDSTEHGTGMILVDAFEQFQGRLVTTNLHITPSSLKNREQAIKDVFERFFAALSAYILDHSPTKLVIAGRQAVTQFEGIPPTQMQTTAMPLFYSGEMGQFFREIHAIHPEFPLPEPDQIQRIVEVTGGKPARLRLLVEVFLAENDFAGTWENGRRLNAICACNSMIVILWRIY